MDSACPDFGRPEALGWLASRSPTTSGPTSAPSPNPTRSAFVLGRLVEREVDRHRALRLKAGQLDDQELADALDRAHELHADLTAIVARLERRLDRRPPTPLDPDR
ncbi:MAG: hypothetical protein ACR2ML_02665 [Solirubrobacteraceae bacterium]